MKRGKGQLAAPKPAEGSHGPLGPPSCSLTKTLTRHAVQVLKEKLREALEANAALQAQLGKAGGRRGAAAGPLAAQNKENAAA